MILVVGPLIAAPPMIGDTATTGACAATISARMSGVARMGSTLRYGFEGQITIARRPGASSASRTCAEGARVAGAVEADAENLRDAAALDEIALEGKVALRRLDDGADRIVRHRQDR